MKKFFLIIILIIFSALIIFYRFTNIPKYLAFDEVEFTKLALSLENKPYIAYSQLATGHSTLYFYILLVSLKTFGINVFALRLPSAVFGILSVLMFYLVIKGLKNYELRIKNYNSLPFLLAVIFLTSRWFLNFSRFSFEATFLLFLELVSIYCLVLANAKVTNFLRLGIPRFLRGGFPRRHKNLLPSISSNFYITLSGLFAGLAFLSYTPGRIFFLLPLTFFVFKLVNSLTRKQFDNKIIKQSLYFLIPLIIIITPLTTYLMTNKDTRIDQQFFLRNSEMTVNEKLNGLWYNVSSTALMFFTKGDMNGRHNYPGKPALNPILGILFIVGLIITIKKWRDFSSRLFLLYFILSLIPALSTYPWENPNMLRTYTVLPSVVYFIGMAIYHLSSIVQRWSLNKRIPRYLILDTLYLILIFSSFYELRTYFKYQSTVFNQSFEIKLPLEKAIRFKFKP